MEKLETGKKVKIGIYNSTVCQTRQGFYLNSYEPTFTQFNIEKKEIFSLLGYNDGGEFPWCRTLNDLQKVYEYIMSKDTNNKKTINVEDLKYPDQVYIQTQEQWDKLKKVCKNILTFQPNNYYLVGGEGRNPAPYVGAASYGQYVLYQFEDIIFPKEKQEDKFIVGKWYTYLNNYIKFTHRKEHQIWGEKVKDGKYYSLDYWSNSDYVKNCILVTDLSIIQPYLPEGHVDKIPVKKSLVFKIGDWVYAEKQKKEDYRLDKHIPVFKIEEITSTGYARAEYRVGNGIEIIALRKAEPWEILDNTIQEEKKTINSSTNVEYSTKGALPLYNVKKRLVFN